MSNRAATPELGTGEYKDCIVTQMTESAKGKVLKHKPLSEVVYLEADHKYVDAYFKDGTSFLLDTPLIDLVRRFGDQFITPSRGLLVNTDYLKGATCWGDEKLTLSVTNDFRDPRMKEFLVSRRRRPTTYKLLAALNIRVSRMTRCYVY